MEHARVMRLGFSLHGSKSSQFAAPLEYENCKCIWPPKWVLMIMTHTIKELMRLLSYEQDLKSLKLKRASIDAKFAKGTVHELH